MLQRITNLPAEELEEFFLLVPRILCDYRDPSRGPYQLAFIYGNTPDNEDSSFLRAIELANAGAVESLGMSEGDRGRGYEGFDHSVARLKEIGFPSGIPIMKFDIGGNVNTLSEAQKLAEYARSIVEAGQSDGDIAIIAPPFHIVRVFMTTITALKRNNVSVRVYAVPGVPLPWLQEAVHSQGLTKKKRAELLNDELQRLEKYQAPEFGELHTPRRVLEYLDWRDA